MKLLHTYNRCVLACLCFIALSGCVTTMDAPERELNLDKAQETHIQMGMTYLQQGDRIQARKHFNKALQIDSKDGSAHLGLALLYQLEKENTLADEHFKLAVKYGGDDVSRSHFNYGTFLYRQKDFQGAYTQYKAAGDDLNYTRRPLAIASKGRSALMMGNREEALASYEHALALSPLQRLAMIELATLKFEDEDYAEAQKYLEQYNKITKPSARSLWLGIRLERIFGNKDKEASYALALKNLFPYSQEYLQYKQSMSSN